VRILHAASEAVPFAKSGGLADVLGALPSAQAALGHSVWVALPWYATLTSEPAPYWIGDIDVPFDRRVERVGVGTLEQAGVHWLFLGHEAFRRASLYGYPDDARRFALFSAAVPFAAQRLGVLPHLVHTHDWHTAFLNLLLGSGTSLPAGFSGLPNILSVHNAQHQGWTDAASLSSWGDLHGAAAGDLALRGAGNLLHAGITSASEVGTVSPGYARELARGEHGYGLESSFGALGERFFGILNGLDLDSFDPHNDPALPPAFDPTSASGRRGAGEALRHQLALEPGRPVVGVVSRLADQKGLDLLLEALPEVLAQGWSVALVGSGEARLEGDWKAAFDRHPGRVGGQIGYDERLARLIYAGAQVLVIPSRFEPCGLTQMIAMRYGSIPVARATGGLKDTIRDGIDGFLFEGASSRDLGLALGRAKTALNHPERWAELLAAAGQRDFSWQRSAQAYLNRYTALVATDAPPPLEREGNP